MIEEKTSLKYPQIYSSSVTSTASYGPQQMLIALYRQHLRLSVATTTTAKTSPQFSHCYSSFYDGGQLEQLLRCDERERCFVVVCSDNTYTTVLRGRNCHDACSTMATICPDGPRVKFYGRAVGCFFLTTIGTVYTTRRYIQPSLGLLSFVCCYTHQTFKFAEFIHNKCY